MTASSREVRDLADAVAEVLDIPLPGTYTPKALEQHRQVLLIRTHYVQRAVKDIAEDRSLRTLAEDVAYIREAVDRYPVEYSTDRAEVRS